MSEQLYYTNMGEPFVIELERDDNNIFVIRAMALPVDMGLMMGSTRFRISEATCQLFNIETHEAYRGQGVGHTLLCLAEGIASTLGAKNVEVEVVPVGVSRRFLNGFFRKHKYEDLPLAENCMRKDLVANPPTTLSR